MRSKMRLKLKLLSFLIAFVLTGSNIAAVSAYAAPAVTKAESGKELDGLEIRNLAEPETGKKLDDKATVVSSGGVTWEIPVIWTDDKGRVSTTAEAGRKYYPTFVFYVPSGYKIKNIAANGSFSVNLPGFVTGLRNTGNMIFASDKANGITYMTWSLNSMTPLSQASNLNPAGNQNPWNNPDSGSSRSSDSRSHSSDDKDSDSDDSDDPSDPYWEARVHCGQNTLNKYGDETLAWIVNLIKHELEPRAIAALLDGFPAFKAAAEKNELSANTGLYVYDIAFETNKSDERNAEGCVAYVFNKYDENEVWKSMVGVNLDKMLELKDGKYVFIEGKQTELENTMVHELMHGLMGDYARTGGGSADWPYMDNMNPDGKYNAFPKWFVEGSATTVENAYVYQVNTFNDILGDADKYTPEAFRKFFGNEKNSITYYLTNYADDVAGAYVGGYLSCVYFSVKVAGINGEYGSKEIRSGLNTILESLHNGKSLDALIRDNTEFDGILGFERDWLDSKYDFVDNTIGYLNYLKGISDSNGKRANGSILLELDTKADSPIESRTETSDGQTIMVVIDASNKVASTADENVAKGTAGSYHAWEDTDTNPEKYAELPAAAKPSAEAVSAADKSIKVEAEDSTEAIETAGALTAETKEEASGNTEGEDGQSSEADEETIIDENTVSDTAPAEEEPVEAAQPADTAEVSDAAQPADTTGVADTTGAADTAETSDAAQPVDAAGAADTVLPSGALDAGDVSDNNDQEAYQTGNDMQGENPVEDYVPEESQDGNVSVEESQDVNASPEGAQTDESSPEDEYIADDGNDNAGETGGEPSEEGTENGAEEDASAPEDSSSDEEGSDDEASSDDGSESDDSSDEDSDSDSDSDGSSDEE